jgi:hypothetical protein
VTTTLRITDTYQLPPEPPVGTRLWDAHGREWVHDRADRCGWTCGAYPSADWWRVTWAGLLAAGPLHTVPPAYERYEASR